MPDPTTSRFTLLPASFFTDPETAGLSPLAALVYIRALTDSLCGVLQRSPRVLARAHGCTPEEGEAAIEELVQRGLARWWGDEELLVVPAGFAQAKGKAAIAARMQVAQLPPSAQAYVLGNPPSHPPSQVPLLHLECKENENESENENERTRGLALVPAPARRTPKLRKPTDPRAEPILALLDKLRTELGKRPLPPSERLDRWIVKRLDEGVDSADMVLALELRAAECRRDMGNFRFFDAISPFTEPGTRGGPGGWIVSMRMVNAYREQQARRRAQAGAPEDRGRSPEFAAAVERERLADLQAREREAEHMRKGGSR